MSLAVSRSRTLANLELRAKMLPHPYTRAMHLLLHDGPLVVQMAQAAQQV